MAKDIGDWKMKNINDEINDPNLRISDLVISRENGAIIV